MDAGPAAIIRAELDVRIRRASRACLALPPRQRAAHLIDGAAPTSRPRAPIVTQKTQATKPVRRPRRRSVPTKKERAPPRSLTESWESLRLFGRKNLGRRLEEEPSDHVHFVNCESQDEEGSSLFGAG